MTRFQARVILLDIEGTTSSVSFVYDVMFPFVRRELDSFLNQHWNDPAVQEACDLIAVDAGHDSLDAWTQVEPASGQALVRDEVHRLMDGDVKATGLKRLQGLVWKHGFESGELRAHLFDDVRDVVEGWQAAGLQIHIYSSGSVQAQKLFFGHTTEGNLLSFFSGHYDTTVGPKREASSYVAIAEAMNVPPKHVLFVSDVPAELDAAAAAGMNVALCCRPGNAEVPAGHGHVEIDRFDQIVIEPVA